MSQQSSQDCMEIGDRESQTKQNDEDMLSALNDIGQEIDEGGASNDGSQDANHEDDVGVSRGASDGEEIGDGDRSQAGGEAQEGESVNGAESEYGSGNETCDVDGSDGEDDEERFEELVPDREQLGDENGSIFGENQGSGARIPQTQRTPRQQTKRSVVPPVKQKIDEEKTLWSNAWTEIIGSFDPKQPANGNDPATALPELPADWYTQATGEQMANIDMKRLFKALANLHSSMSKVLQGSDITTELAVRPKPQHSGYAKCRAHSLALLDVVLAYEDGQVFQDRVDADLQRTAKTAWFSTHPNEANEASKRKVAVDVLNGLSDDERTVADATVTRESAKLLKQWQKAADARILSNAQITKKFSRLFKDPHIILTAEYVTDIEKYEKDVADMMKSSTVKDRGWVRRSAEGTLALKMLGGLESVVREELQERAEALAVVMTADFIEDKQKTGANTFLAKIMNYKGIPRKATGNRLTPPWSVRKKAAKRAASSNGETENDAS